MNFLVKLSIDIFAYFMFFKFYKFNIFGLRYVKN